MMTVLAEAIKKIATGPRLSKDLTEDEAFQAMLEILSGDADNVRAAIFFIALRIKTETSNENFGIYRAMQQQTNQQNAQVEQLLILTDPFNGFTRHCPLAAFLPAVLSACGLPCLSQGVYEMGPKFGVTHAQVLQQAGRNITQTVEQVTTAINTADIGWGYLDQAQASPKVFALQALRTRMIKRPCIATLEKLLMPIKAQSKTHLAIGFVHKPYPPLLADLAFKAGFGSALIIRGVEGGVIPTLRKPSNNFRMLNGAVEPVLFEPAQLAIELDTRGLVAEQASTEKTLQHGLAALAGEQGVAFDSLLYGAAINLWHVGLQSDLPTAARHVRDVILSGKAKAHFDRGIA